MWNVAMLWNVPSLFVYFVSQYAIPTFGRFLLEIFCNFLVSVLFKTTVHVVLSQ